MRPSGPHGSGGQNGRKPLQNPTLVERPPDVGLAVHESEVAAHGIHRQPRLGRVVAVVPVDQIVDLGEVPPPRDPPPATAERALVGAFRGQSTPESLECPTVKVRQIFDRPEARHVRQRPAHRRDVALDGTAHRLWTWPQRPAAEWAPFQRALERDALTPLAPVLPANTPLAENLRALFRLHSGAIVPITECYPCRARSR